MVSRRKPAALGVRPVLAQGRRADLEESRSDRAAEKVRARPASPRSRRALRGSIAAKKLGVDSEFVMPAFEDPAHWLQKEAGCRQCRSERSKLADPEERARMARVFDRG
jgi:uncharacterized protein (DUF2126 family)